MLICWFRLLQNRWSALIDLTLTTFQSSQNFSAQLQWAKLGNTWTKKMESSFSSPEPLGPLSHRPLRTRTISYRRLRGPSGLWGREWWNRAIRKGKLREAKRDTGIDSNFQNLHTTCIFTGYFVSSQVEFTDVIAEPNGLHSDDSRELKQTRRRRLTRTSQNKGFN